MADDIRVAIIPLQTVTTVAGESGNRASLSGLSLIPEGLSVVFNGQKYECPRVGNDPSFSAYGGATEEGTDFSKYPFAITVFQGTGRTGPVTSWGLDTKFAGTFTIEAYEKTPVQLVVTMRAVKTFSNGHVSMHEGEVRELYSDNPYQEEYNQLFQEGYVEEYIEPIVPQGEIEITENGSYDVAEYESALVEVSGGVEPTGTVNITANGTHDVTNYASANVNVPSFGYGELTITNNLGVEILVKPMDTDGTYGGSKVANDVNIPNGQSATVRITLGYSAPSKSAPDTISGFIAIRTNSSVVIPNFSVGTSATPPKATADTVNFMYGKVSDHTAYIHIDYAKDGSGKYAKAGGIVLNVAS